MTRSPRMKECITDSYPVCGIWFHHSENKGDSIFTDIILHKDMRREQFFDHQ